MVRSAGSRWCPPYRALVFVLLTAMLPGCAERTGTFSGKITCRGIPVARGSIVFVSERDKKKIEGILLDGRYIIGHAPTGPGKIGVTSVPYTPIVMPGKIAPLPIKQANVPDKYADPETSGLTHVVEPGNQFHDIEIGP